MLEASFFLTLLGDTHGTVLQEAMLWLWSRVSPAEPALNHRTRRLLAKGASLLLEGSASARCPREEKPQAYLLLLSGLPWH